VETGTSSYYSSLGDATDEPVLKAICKRIAADEFRHYKLFYEHLRRYLERERPGNWRRFRVVLGRVLESRNDDELPFAYHCANEGREPHDRRRSARAYFRRAYGYYAPIHINRATAMMLKAVGIEPNGRLGQALARVAYRLLRFEIGRLRRANA